MDKDYIEKRLADIDIQLKQVDAQGNMLLGMRIELQNMLATQENKEKLEKKKADELENKSENPDQDSQAA